MKKVLALLASIILTVLMTIPANATSAWYQVSFTGADIWTYSADNALQSRTDQTAPRRYAEYTTGSRVLVATTYGVGGLPTTGFSTNTAVSNFAFDAINLCGKGGIADSWGEKYVSVAGVSSWVLIQAPTGWTDGIVQDNTSYNPGDGAFPVWRSGTGNTLSQTNMNNADFKFTFDVLISNPATAFDSNGQLAVWFGGFNDDLQMTGPDNYEVSGIMRLDAHPVPLPSTVLLLGSGLAGLAFYRQRRASLKA